MLYKYRYVKRVRLQMYQKKIKKKLENNSVNADSAFTQQVKLSACSGEGPIT